MNKIEIVGFSPLQQAIADMVWHLQTADEIIDWYNACRDEIKPIAHAVISMLRYEYLDQIPIEDFSQALEIINQVKEL